MRPKGTAEELEARRRRALAMLEDGWAVNQVAAHFGVSRRSVSQWRRAHREQGEDGLRARPAPGRSPKLSDDQFQQLRRLLIDGPTACGFATDLWTCPRVRQLILDRFGVSYHVDHLSRLIREMGFTPQKPVRRAAERDEAEIQRWVRVDWPRIKKNRPVSTPTSCSSTRPACR